MTYTEVQPLAFAILTSIITGGFVLVFIEIGNRKNRENDRHDQIMLPFMHKLTAYLRFMSWCSGRIKYPKLLEGYEEDFKTLVNDLAGYGGRAITSGGDYEIGHFSADELYQIALDINNVWYFHDKMRPCRLTWESCGNEKYISKELKDINPNYLSEKQDVDLVVKVSGDFYTDVYLQIENEIYRHEAFIEQYRRQTIAVVAFFTFVLLMLSLMLFIKLPVLFLQISTFCVILLLIASLLMLAVDVRLQFKWWNLAARYFKTRKWKSVDLKKRLVVMKKVFNVIVDFLLPKLVRIGLVFSAWAIFSIELHYIPTIQCSWQLETIEGWNRIFLALAYSYVAGAIIYWLTSRLPYLRNKRHLAPVIKSKIDEIGNHLSNMNLEFRDEEKLQNPEITDEDAIMEMFTVSRWTEKCRIPIHDPKINVTEAFINDYHELCAMVSLLINDYKFYLSNKQLIVLENLRSEPLKIFESVGKISNYTFSEYFYTGILQPSYKRMLEQYNRMLSNS